MFTRSVIIFATICIYNGIVMECHTAGVETSQSNLNGIVVDVPSGTLSRDTARKMGHNVTIEGDSFVVDGEPLKILSGSLHYFRLPAAYWRDRLQKLKAAGLNSVSTYVEWSYHEPEERKYLFEGDRDIAQFIRIAAEVGLHVLLRPGPYICAERDLGGFPYWLLGKYPNIKLRTPDGDLTNETRIWLAKLFEQLTPLLFGNGGPIILVQVENEYGSYGSDKRYLGLLRDMLLEHVGTNALLYTTDGASGSCTNGLFVRGSISGALTSVDFGAGNTLSDTTRNLRCFMPHGPLMNSEYYPGWLTHWGEPTSRVPTHSVIKTFREMLNNNWNINFYVFFGGTNFEYTSGANHDDGIYHPDITSYDYDAPLTEAGDPTEKYFAIRDAIKNVNPEVEQIAPPIASPKGAYGLINVAAKLSLLSDEGRKVLGKKYSEVIGENLPTFEALRQRSGLVLYEIVLTEADREGMLVISKPRDHVYVYIDGEFRGGVSRAKKIFSLPVSFNTTSVLSLLVENQGRINYGMYIHDFKGILSTVLYNDKVLNGTWSITGYPLETINYGTQFSNTSNDGSPRWYEGSFTLPAGEEPMDTFIDTANWGKLELGNRNRVEPGYPVPTAPRTGYQKSGTVTGFACPTPYHDKGYIWVNGHHLGRYWPAEGPQRTLYLPGVWLKAAPEVNQIQVLELFHFQPAKLQVQSIDHPIFSR